MIDVVTIPALRDNYAFLIADRAAGTAVVIDPSEAPPVLDALAREGLALAGIWLTHHHWDHVGGIPGLLERAPGIPVVGSRHDAKEGRITGQTLAVGDGDRVEHAGISFDVIEIPGHTLGAIAFVGGGAAFTGDTLFLAGCGRVFEGTMPQMRASLARLRALDPSTRIYCGHEYTVKNLEFACLVEAGEIAVHTRLEAARATRAEGRPTVPGTLEDELRSNPFLRWDSPAVRAFAEGRGAVESEDDVFARVRQAKDAF